MSLTFMSDNKVLGADLSMVVGTVNAQFPLANIKQDFTTKVFRSNETTVEILVDLQVTTLIDAFCLVGSSVDGIGIGDISIQGSGSVDFSGSPVITIDLNSQYNFGFKLFTGVSFRFWKLTITNVGGDYIELSNIFLGTKTQLLTNGFSTQSFNYKSRDNVSIKTNRYGQRFIDVYNRLNVLSGTVQHANQTEFDAINDIYIQNGRTTPLFFILDPDGDTVTDGEFLFSGYFYLTNDPSWSFSGPKTYNVSLILEEGA